MSLRAPYIAAGEARAAGRQRPPAPAQGGGTTCARGAC